MKTNNFTNEELGMLVAAVSPKLNVRVNRAGNLTVENPKGYGTSPWVYPVTAYYWTLYKTSNGYVWRCLNSSSGYCYPLNMVKRNEGREIPYSYTYPNGETVTTTYKTWCYEDHSMFKTMEAAVNYFVMYLKKYRHINF